MKTIIFLLFTIPALSQQLADVSKLWVTKNIKVTDGHIEKWIIPDNQDTARYFHADGKRYLVTATFTEIKGSSDTIVLETIDDNDIRNVVSGAMIKAGGTTANGFYKNTLTYRTSLSAAGKVSFKFTGNKIAWWGESKSTHGSVDLICDGVSYRVNLYVPPFVVSKVLLTIDELSDGNHTIEIIPVGNSQFVHDRWDVYTKTIVPR